MFVGKIVYKLFEVKFLLAESDFGYFSHCLVHNRGACDSSASFGVFGAHKMSAAGLFVLDLAGGGDFNSFTQPLMAFLFRHLRYSFELTQLK